MWDDIESVSTPFFMVANPQDAIDAETVSSIMSFAESYNEIGVFGVHNRYITLDGKRRGVYNGLGEFNLELFKVDPLHLYHGSIIRKAFAAPLIDQLRTVEWECPMYALRLALATRHPVELSRRPGYYIRFTEDSQLSGVPYRETYSKLVELGVIAE